MYGYGTPIYNVGPSVSGYQMQQPAPQQESLRGRVVGSEEEARAVPTDFSGAPVWLPDPSHGVVYCKKLNSMGASDLFVYKMVQQAPTQADALQALQERVAKLEEVLAKEETKA